MAKQLYYVMSFLLALFCSMREVFPFHQQGNRLHVVSSIQRKHEHTHCINVADDAVLFSQPNSNSPSSSSYIPPLRRQYRVLSIFAPILLGVSWGKCNPLRLSSLLLTAKAFDILRSAARRKRLDATTFKFLNVGSFLSLGYLFAVQYMDGGAATVLCNKEKLALKFVSIFGVLTSGAALTKYGLPTMKVKGSNLLSLSYMLCASLAIYTGMDFNTLKNIFDPIQVFLFPAVFLALSGASIAGDKRLASDTYKGLNMTVLLMMVSRLGMEKRGLVSVTGQHPYAYIYTTLSALSCLVGLYKGKAYGKGGPMLLKAFSKD